MVEYFREKAVQTFAERKDTVKECPACLIGHNYSLMELMIKFYIQYDRVKARERLIPCISSDRLKLYVRNKIPENDKGHLICCESCTDKLLNLTGAYSIWNSLKEEADRTSEWIRKIYLLSSLAKAPSKTVIAEKKIFFSGEEVYLKVHSNKDGYLTIIHWNGEDINIVLPNIYEKDTFVKANGVKELKARIDPPPGIQEVKIFLTEVKILETEGIDFQDKSIIQRKIKEFVEKLREVEKDWWVKSYEVKKSPD